MHEEISDQACDSFTLSLTSDLNAVSLVHVTCNIMENMGVSLFQSCKIVTVLV